MNKRRNNRGYVLVAVLGFIVLAMIIAISLSGTMRLSISSSAKLGAQAEAEALADGIAFVTSAAVLSRPTGWPIGSRAGTPYICAFENRAVAIDVVNVAGLVDVNAASELLLAKLLGGLGLKPEMAGQLAAAIADFRDEDDLGANGGTELELYRAAGLKHGPKNRAFQTTGELDQVVGMPAALVSILRELTTVHSQSATVDVRFAPVRLIEALVEPEDAALDLETKRGRVAALFGTAGTASELHRITVEVGNARGGNFRRRVVIEAKPFSSQGYLVREWTALAASGAVDTTDTRVLPSCPGLPKTLAMR
jgi:general secretion pathway protein K